MVIRRSGQAPVLLFLDQSSFVNVGAVESALWSAWIEEWAHESEGNSLNIFCIYPFAFQSSPGAGFDSFGCSEPAG